MDSFLKHLDIVFKAIPNLDSSVYKPKVVNAYRLAKKELQKIINQSK